MQNQQYQDPKEDFADKEIKKPADIPPDSYGLYKMEQFKRNARAILSDSTSTRDMTFINNVEYRQSDVTDIVTAYKSLKGTLLKAQGGSKQINQVPPNASYLRKTIAVQ